MDVCWGVLRLGQNPDDVARMLGRRKLLPGCLSNDFVCKWIFYSAQHRSVAGLRVAQRLVDRKFADTARWLIIDLLVLAVDADALLADAAAGVVIRMQEGRAVSCIAKDPNYPKLLRAAVECSRVNTVAAMLTEMTPTSNAGRAVVRSGILKLPGCRTSVFVALNFALRQKDVFSELALARAPEFWEFIEESFGQKDRMTMTIHMINILLETPPMCFTDDFLTWGIDFNVIGIDRLVRLCHAHEVFRALLQKHAEYNKKTVADNKALWRFLSY